VKYVVAIARALLVVPVALITLIVVLPGALIEGKAKRDMDVYY
jgi:hypothetical protein